MEEAFLDGSAVVDVEEAQHPDEHLADGAVRDGRLLAALHALVQGLGHAGAVV